MHAPPSSLAIAPAQLPRAQRCRSAASATTQPVQQLVVRAAHVRNPSRGHSITLPALRLPQAAGGAGAISQHWPNCQACNAARRWQTGVMRSRTGTDHYLHDVHRGWSSLWCGRGAPCGGVSERHPSRAQGRVQLEMCAPNRLWVTCPCCRATGPRVDPSCLPASTHIMRHWPAAVGTHAWRCRPARRALAASPLPGRLAPTDHARARTACTGLGGAAMSAAWRTAGRWGLSLPPSREFDLFAGPRGRLTV